MATNRRYLEKMGEVPFDLSGRSTFPEDQRAVVFLQRLRLSDSLRALREPADTLSVSKPL